MLIPARGLDGRKIFRSAFDLSMVVLEVLFFGLLVRRWEDLTFKLYLPAYLLYCFGLSFKHHDPDYMRGLAWFSRKKLFWVAVFLLLQTTLGALAFGSLQVILDTNKPAGFLLALDILALLILFPLALMVMVRLIQKARKQALVPASSSATPASARRSPLAYFSDFGMWIMGLVLLAFFYNQASMIKQPLGPTFYGILGSLFLTFALGLLFYFPARFHYILENPRDKWNWISFISAMVLFALFLIRGR